MGHRTGPDPAAAERYRELRQSNPYVADRYRYALDYDPGPDAEPPEWAARPDSGRERESVTLTQPRKATTGSEEP